jgi:hypothetical protein
VQVALERRDAGEDPDVVVTDAEGRFAGLLPGPGDYNLRTFHPRYEPILYPLEVHDSDEAVEVRVEMKPQPLELEGIFVEAKKKMEGGKLERVGFLRRSRSGAGRYLGPEDMEFRRFSIRQLLRGFPGLRVTYDEDLRMTNRWGGTCRPEVFVDGIRLAPGFSVRLAVSLFDVEAIEVYNRPAFAPAQYRGVYGSGCGTILFWLR